MSVKPVLNSQSQNRPSSSRGDKVPPLLTHRRHDITRLHYDSTATRLALTEGKKSNTEGGNQETPVVRQAAPPPPTRSFFVPAINSGLLTAEYTTSNGKKTSVFDYLYREALDLKKRRVALASRESFREDKKMWDGFHRDRDPAGHPRSASAVRSPWKKREEEMQQKDNNVRGRSASVRPSPRKPTWR